MTDEKKQSAPDTKPHKNIGDNKASENENQTSEQKKTESPFPVVCLGASAGGLKSLESFLSNVPRDCGIAFVVLSHTDPDHSTLLPEILKRKSNIPVTLLDSNRHPEPNTVFLPPSNKDLMVEKGTLVLKDRQPRDGLHMPIDAFLKSLAENFGEKSGCVVLSGTGTDGTQGLRTVKEKGGVTAAEKKSSALYFGMPQSAIQTGLVDFILEPQDIPEEIFRYFRQSAEFSEKGYKKNKADKDFNKILTKILWVVSNRTNHDFSKYKKSTVIRRIGRRMSVNHTQHITDYLDYLHRNPAEPDALFQELLIGVTEFFRDRDIFSSLKKDIIPEMVSRLNKDDTLRIWVAGCSTGEEVYSLSIILDEYLREHQIRCGLQVFGTDIDDQAITKAREGEYLHNIAANIGRDRLERYFFKTEHHYRVKKEIREPVVFAVHDILRDPPFTRLDLLMCRNLLIYLEAEAQEKLIPLFHYSLKPEGILVLGTSESPNRYPELFRPVDKKQSVYKKIAIQSGTRPPVEFPSGIHASEASAGEHPLVEKTGEMKPAGISHATERILMNRYTPACVIVNKNGHVVHVHGKTGKYLELPIGKPNLDITQLAREGLRFALSSALRKAVSTSGEVCQSGIRVKTNGGFQEIDLRVIPINEPSPLQNTVMVLFEEIPDQPEKDQGKAKSTDAEETSRRIIDLEKELTQLREEHRSTQEELETSNEELKSYNEEMQSQNEELQSTNEELESSREELQSVNEELNTVNSQLQTKMDELADAYASITDVLNSTRIAVLFLDNSLCIKRFTKAAAALTNLIDTDIGRSITHISHNLDIEDLPGKIHRVSNSLSSYEDDIRTTDGHWYRITIMPHRSHEHSIEGTVLTFINIDTQKEAQHRVEQMKTREIAAAKRFSESIIHTVREALLVLDWNFRILSANRRFYDLFKTDSEKTEGKNLFELGNGRWDVKQLRSLFNRITSEGTPFEDYRIELQLPDDTKKQFLLNARPLVEQEPAGNKILFALEDISARNI